MCGIFGLFNHQCIQNEQMIRDAFNSAAHRGPDNSTLTLDRVSHSYLGFHRLTINGAKHYYSSNQPICKNDIVLLCNGEIYNYHTLLDELDLTPLEKQQQSGSDCEIIIDLYLKFGIDTTLELLDGVFAFILMDMRCLSGGDGDDGDGDDSDGDDIGDGGRTPKIIVARDPFGLRPLYWLKHTDDFLDGCIPELVGSCMTFGFSSEMKQLAPIMKHIRENIETYSEGGTYSNVLDVQAFPPGHYCVYEGSLIQTKHKDNRTFSKNVAWFIKPSAVTLTKYFTFPHFRHQGGDGSDGIERIKDYLINAVDKRIHCTDRPIACLLSGGVDSSLVCGIIRHLLPEDAPLETYSIGLRGSSDEKYIKEVVDHINSTHVYVECEKTDFLNAIPVVIRLLETYDTTTVRASVGNYLIANFIRITSDAKVIFNGDGSDELFGGYKYFLNCPNKYEFHKERKRLLSDIHHFDVLRSERSMSVNGLEARTPFLDKELVSYVMTLTNDLTFTPRHSSTFKTSDSCVFDEMKKSGVEKWMLRRAFVDSNLIPESILFRSKEAFSDGVSDESESWYSIIQKFLIHLLATNVKYVTDNGWVVKKSVLFQEDQGDMEDDYINVDELSQDKLYVKITAYHRQLTGVGVQTLSNKEIAELSITVEKWYYKKIYDHYYAPINTVPYYWMPNYSADATDPSARTLPVYAKSANVQHPICPRLDEESDKKYSIIDAHFC